MQVSCKSQNRCKVSLQLPLKKNFFFLSQVWPLWKLLTPHCNTTAQWNSPRNKCSLEIQKSFLSKGTRKRKEKKKKKPKSPAPNAQLQRKTHLLTAWSRSTRTNTFTGNVGEEARLDQTVSPWLCRHHPRPHRPLSGQRPGLPVPIPAARSFPNCENKRAVGPRKKICGEATPPQKQRGPQSLSIGTSAPGIHKSGDSPVQSERKKHTPLSGNGTDFRWSAPWHLCPARLICACSATVACSGQNASLFQVCVGF